MTTDEPASASTGALVGYVRVSTAQQTYDAQIDALAPLGCVRTFSDVLSGVRADRPGFRAMLDYVRSGDTVAVTGFDRFGRSTAQIFATLADLTERGIHVRGLREGIDTRTIHGRMVAGLFIVIAQYERELTMERASVARSAAMDRGQLPGRPRKLSADDRRRLDTLRASGESVPELARHFSVHPSTIYRLLADGVASP